MHPCKISDNFLRGQNHAILSILGLQKNDSTSGMLSQGSKPDTHSSKKHFPASRTSWGGGCVCSGLSSLSPAAAVFCCFDPAAASSTPGAALGSARATPRDPAPAFSRNILLTSSPITFSEVSSFHILCRMTSYFHPKLFCLDHRLNGEITRLSEANGRMWPSQTRSLPPPFRV